MFDKLKNIVGNKPKSSSPPQQKSSNDTYTTTPSDKDNLQAGRFTIRQDVGYDISEVNKYVDECESRINQLKDNQVVNATYGEELDKQNKQLRLENERLKGIIDDLRFQLQVLEAPQFSENESSTVFETFINKNNGATEESLEEDNKTLQQLSGNVKIEDSDDDELSIVSF